MSEKSEKSEKNDKGETSDAAEPTKKSSSRKFIAIGGVVVVLIAGGGGAFWWFSRSAKAASPEGDAKKETAAAVEAGGVVPLEPFLVNLADTSGSRYLRTTLKLVVPDEKIAEKLTKNEVATTRARSAILELLTTQTAEQLVTTAGKSALKKAICERVTPLMGVEVSDVLFADFVVQF